MDVLMKIDKDEWNQNEKVRYLCCKFLFWWFQHCIFHKGLSKRRNWHSNRNVQGSCHEKYLSLVWYAFIIQVALVFCFRQFCSNEKGLRELKKMEFLGSALELDLFSWRALIHQGNICKTQNMESVETHNVKFGFRLRVKIRLGPRSRTVDVYVVVW